MRSQYRMRKTLFLSITLLAFILFSSISTAGQTEPGQFLVISDIHFDPFYDGTIFEQLDAQPVENWPTILEQSQPPGFNPRETDSNFALLTSSLDDAHQRMPNPDFLLYPGDFLAHRWQSKYDQLAKRSHLADPVAFREFTTKAIQLVALEFQRRYPNTPILPTLGNDDSYCGDYMITPNGPFLSMFAEVWAPLLGVDGDREVFQSTFSRGGHYTIKLPHLKNQRLVVLNSVFFSVSYDNACGQSTQTPALDQLRWLAQTLEQAEAVGDRVWLLMHVPPGINSFNTAESVGQGGPAVTFWQPELTSRFLVLVEQYQATIQTAFYGHTHMDDFRVVQLKGAPVLFGKIAPAISPIFGNNPGYQVFQYDRTTGDLWDYQTYYLTNLGTDERPTDPIDAHWALEYDFRTAYDLSALNPRTIAGLAERIKTDPEIERRYTTFYSVRAEPQFNADTVDVFRCAITHVTPSEFQLCFRGVPKPVQSPSAPGRVGAAAVDD